MSIVFPSALLVMTKKPILLGLSRTALALLVMAQTVNAAPSVITITCDVLNEQKDEFTVVDVRFPGDYRRVHIEGAISVPYEKLEKLDLPKDRKIAAYCSGVGCSLSHDAVIVLQRKGYRDVRMLAGGIAEWELKGYPVVREARAKAPVGTELLKGKEVTAGEAKKFLGRIQVLDVRPSTEFQAGHIPGALNIPLEKLAESVDQLAGEVLIVDRVPMRWKKAVEILTQEGRFAHAVAGGMGVWAASGHPLEVGGR